MFRELRDARALRTHRAPFAAIDPTSQWRHARARDEQPAILRGKVPPVVAPAETEQFDRDTLIVADWDASRSDKRLVDG